MSPLTQGELTKKTVLWVYWSKNFSTLALEEKGYEVFTYSPDSAQDVIDYIQEQKEFNLVVIHLNSHSPHIFDYLKAIKKIDPCLPVVLLSQSKNTRLLNRCLAMGGILLQKPYDLAELAPEFDVLIENAKKSRERLLENSLRSCA